jgi:transcriptional regulator with XRE-family HTH domain
MEKSEKAKILRLKELMKEKGVSRYELHQKVGLTETTISNINSGLHLPSIENLLKIAEALDVDVRELFNPSKEGRATSVEVNKATELLKEALDLLGADKP